MSTRQRAGLAERFAEPRVEGRGMMMRVIRQKAAEAGGPLQLSTWTPPGPLGCWVTCPFVETSTP